MEWNGGRQLLMDDDILDGQQPGKREEGAELGGQSSQKRREEEEGGSFVFFFVKLLRALKYGVVVGDFSRVSHVVAPTASAVRRPAVLPRPHSSEPACRLSPRRQRRR